jgi:hypothetical protein
MSVAVASACLRGSKVRALLKQHGFEAIKLRLQVGCAPELDVDLLLLALDLDPLLIDATPLFLKLRPDCGVTRHLALLRFGTPRIEWLRCTAVSRFAHAVQN